MSYFAMFKVFYINHMYFLFGKKRLDSVPGLIEGKSWRLQNPGVGDPPP